MEQVRPDVNEWVVKNTQLRVQEQHSYIISVIIDCPNLAPDLLINILVEINKCSGLKDSAGSYWDIETT